MEIADKPKEQDFLIEADPLKLDIEDKDLLKALKAREKQSESDFKLKGIPKKQDENEKYYLGKQIEESHYKEHNARYVDNLIYESVATIMPIAFSRMPELLVKPGKDDEESKKASEVLSMVLTDDIKQREMKRMVEMAVKHSLIYLIGALKYRWNPELGRDGDYQFEFIHPKNLILDSTANSNDPNKMDICGDKYYVSLKEMIMRFPDKKEKILKAAGIDLNDETKKEEKLASKGEIHELWFTWYEEATEEKEPHSYNRVEGVAWYYKNVLLKKSKNPNWDWEGKLRTFVYDTAKKEDRKPSAEEMRQSMYEQMGFEDKTFHNYFENPEKPYILLGYDQLGKGPYDETSMIEQVIYLQDNINKRGRQITEMADRTRGIWAFGSDSGLKADDVQDFDMANPNQKLWLKGKLSDGVAHYPGEQPSAALFQDQEINRGRVFDKMGVHSTTRGKKETNVATTSQILREADYGRIDHFTDEVINYAFEKMARAAMQMIKLRYTEDHVKRVVGKDGNVVFQRINQDMVTDGMEVVVYASGVDKTMRKREAYERAKMKLTDPLTFFEDTDVPDPKTRTERLLTFMKDPATYETKYVLDLQTSQDQAGALNDQNSQPNQPTPPTGQPGQQPQPNQGGQDVMMDIAMLQQGQMPTMPGNLDPQYVQTLGKFLSSPDFKALSPQVQQMAVQYAQQVQQSISQVPAQPTPKL